MKDPSDHPEDRRDDAERPDIEEALRASEARYRLLFENAIEGIFQTTFDGRFIMINRALAHILGYTSPQEALEKITDLGTQVYADPSDRKLLIESLLQNGVMTGREVLFKKRDGTPIKVLLNFRLTRDKNGNPQHIEGSCIDITDRWRAEEALKASEEKYRQLHEGVMDAVASASMDGTLREWECNDVFLNMMGYTRDEIKQRTYMDITPEKWHAFESRIVEKKVLPRGYSDIYEKEYRRKNGSVFPVELRAYLQRDSEGRPSGIWAIIRDVTERKEAEERLKEANRRLSNIIEFLPDATLITDGDGRIVAWNRALEEMTGVAKQDIIGRDHEEAMVPFYGKPGPFLIDYIGPKDNDILPRYSDIRRKGKILSAEVYTPALYQGKGAHIWATASPLYDGSGNLIGAIESIRDVSARKEAEEQRRKSEEKYRTIFENAVEGVFQTNMEGRFATVNPALARILGYDSAEELLQETSNITQQYYARPEDRLRIAELTTAKGHIGGFEVELMRRDGKKIWCSLNVRLVRDPNGNPLYFEGSCTEVTDWKMADQALRESQQRLADIIDFLPDAMIVIDRKGLVTAWNRAMETMTGITAREMLGKGNYEYALPFYGERRPILIDIALLPSEEIEKKYSYIEREGSLVIGEAYAPMMIGGARFLSGWAQPIYDASGEIAGAIECIRDSTDKHKAEDALKESEARYRLLAENASDVIFTVDMNLRLTYISPSVERIRGFTAQEVMSQSLDENLTKDSVEKVQKNFAEALAMEANGQQNVWLKQTLELEEYCKDGSTIFTETTITPLRDDQKRMTGFLGITRDITDRRKAEEEKARLETRLVQAQKMESIGTLAGGIAHDFNNILAAIFGYSELAMEDAADGEKVRQHLQSVLKAGERAKELVAQILTFSRKTETAYSPLALRTVIKESLKMMRSVIPTTIEIRQHIAASGLILSDPTQIHQIIMNLCTNAAHAMEETGGILDVGLQQVQLNQEGAADLDVLPGAYLKLTVKDTGRGMTPQVMERIFEPYFTTKELGRGTGLGLSVVHGIIRSHNGAITCRSSVGEGTTFDIYLPEIEREKHDVLPSVRPPLPTGTERILFVDDEAVLTELADRMLTALGYAVTVKNGSVEALDVFKKKPDAFDLVITDMTMPVMTGEKLARQILEVRSDIPIILCTGYSDSMSEEKSFRLGIRAFLFKPMVMMELAETIRKVLDTR